MSQEESDFLRENARRSPSAPEFDDVLENSSRSEEIESGTF